MNNSTVTIGDYIFSAEALRAAKWDTVEDLNANWRIINDGCEDTFEIFRDEIAWRSIEATVADVSGETHEVKLERTDADDATVYVDHDEMSQLEIDGEWSAVEELEDLIGEHIEQNWDADTEAAADDIVLNYAEAVFVLDNHRGFANEWTLYICASEEKAVAVEELRSNTERLDANKAASYLSDALMSGDQYERKYGIASCVSVVLA